MTLHIAIQPDNYTNPKTPEKFDNSSVRWAASIEAAGHKVKWVDVKRPDILNQLSGCQGFMWRWGHSQGMAWIARRLLPVIEKQLGMQVYPDQNTCWHYNDKIAQTHLLKAMGIPTPETWVWYDDQAAKEWANHATYPLVHKLANGAGSRNIKLIHNAAEAHLWIDRLFHNYLVGLDEEQFAPLGWKKRLWEIARLTVRGTQKGFPNKGVDPQAGYVYFQEFLENNPFDTRVTVIGNRAFAFRRYNRENDFRASGSGKIDWDVSKIDLSFVRLAYHVARAIQSQSCAIDGLYRSGQCVVNEISYTYASWAVYQCPGHWELSGDPEHGDLTWVEEQMWPEEAQVEDFMHRLSNG